MNQKRGIFKEPLLWAFLLVPVFFLAYMCCGSYPIGLNDLFSPSPMLEGVLKLRATRLICGFVVGGSLAVAGAACQAALRNPLAEPYILGISGGASFGAALAIITGLAAISEFFIPGFSFIGAAVALGIVLGLSQFWTSDASSSIALAGVVVGSIFSSLLMFLISISGSHELNNVVWWMLGSLQPSGNLLLIVAAGTLLAGTLLLTIFGREVDAITFGEETAFSFGTDPRMLSYLLLAVASVLAACSVAVAGIISFVGLIAPHVIRRLFGAGHRRLFPLCLALGGIFLMSCDTFARCLWESRELPVGVVTALIGGPFFLWILSCRRTWQ